MTAFLEPQPSGVPHARPTAVSEPFWAGCSAGELRFQRCTACGSAEFPPSEVCRTCLVGPLAWKRSAGLGRLYSWTVVWRAVTPAFTTPYAPAIIRLDEGYDMVTNIVNATVDELIADLPVRVVFHRAGDLHLPYFAPTTD